PFLFFQAEDGIRDFHVTGVQTCALPIFGAEVVQIGLGDPNHGTWKEGPRFSQALEDSGLELSGTMIGYAGEDYTTPATIQRTGGFGDPATRAERLEIFKAAVEQTAELGLRILCSHAGFIP